MSEEDDSYPLLDYLLADLCACGHPNFGHKRDPGTDKYSPNTFYKCQEDGCSCAHLYDR